MTERRKGSPLAGLSRSRKGLRWAALVPFCPPLLSFSSSSTAFAQNATGFNLQSKQVRLARRSSQQHIRNTPRIFWRCTDGTELGRVFCRLLSLAMHTGISSIWYTLPGVLQESSAEACVNARSRTMTTGAARPSSICPATTSTYEQDDAPDMQEAQ